jgi:hypothetical protein
VIEFFCGICDKDQYNCMCDPWKPLAKAGVVYKEIAAAREEGRREGYAACTADVVAWLEAQAKAAHELYAEVGAGSYRSRAMALEGAAGEIADGEHVGAAGKVKP